MGCVTTNTGSALWSDDTLYTFGENLGHLGQLSDNSMVYQPTKVNSTLRYLVTYYRDDGTGVNPNESYKDIQIPSKHS